MSSFRRWLAAVISVGILVMLAPGCGGGGSAPNPPATHGISGKVTGAASVVVTLTPGGATATTDGSGNYGFSGLADGAYTVTPSKAGYAFTPPSANATVAGGDVTQDFAAAGTRQIAGTISVGATPLAGVSVTRSGSLAPAVTGADGAYAFAGLEPGTFTVTPTLAGYTFAPASLSVDVTGADAAGQDFTASGGGALRLYLGESDGDPCEPTAPGVNGGLCPTNPIPDGLSIGHYVYSHKDWATTLSGDLRGTGYGITLQLGMPPSTTATGRAEIILGKGSAETVLFATDVFTVNSNIYSPFTFTGSGVSADGVSGDQLILRVTCLSGCSAALRLRVTHHSDQTSYIDVPSIAAPSGRSISGTVRAGSTPM